MFKRSWLVVSASCLLWVLGAKYAPAQTPSDLQSQSPQVIAACSTGFVRFTSPGKVYEMRLEVFAADGQTLYDSDFRFGNLLDWNLRDQQGQPLADGAYRCLVTVRALSGRLGNRQGLVLLQDGQPALQAPQSSQDIRPENHPAVIDHADFLALRGKWAALPLTILAHDGQQGLVVSGSGGLSFRLGDFFAGKDVEHMRLTPEGNLGIGVENPQARLDVAGVIRASGGVMFPDGTIQTTAANAPSRTVSGRSGMQRDTQPRTASLDAPGNIINPVINISGSGTTNRITKWLDGPNGVVGDSAVSEVGGNIGIGTTNPQSQLHITRSLRIDGLDTAGGYRAITFAGSDYATSPNIYTNGNYLVVNARNGANPLYLNFDAGSTSTTIMQANGGNVGIGTVSPSYKLHVEGGSGTAIYGQTSGGSGFAGVRGKTAASSGYGVWGEYTGSGSGIGVYGYASGAAGYGVQGQASGTGYGVVGTNTDLVNGVAGQFNGHVNISGTLSKGAGSFKIDHPLDPANKYLYHSFVESPDMMNIYNGNVTTDQSGEAEVALPDYFAALNRDFRYQLTVIGQFAQAIIAREIEGSSFTIKTDKPGVKVSWQVTGIRQDAYAEAHRIRVEEEKPERERGSYLHPELHGQPEEKGVEWARNPEMMRRLKQQREKAQEEKEKKSN